MDTESNSEQAGEWKVGKTLSRDYWAVQIEMGKSEDPLDYFEIDGFGTRQQAEAIAKQICEDHNLRPQLETIIKQRNRHELQKHESCGCPCCNLHNIYGNKIGELCSELAKANEELAKMTEDRNRGWSEFYRIYNGDSKA